MIGTQGANFVILLILIQIGVYGVVAGGLTCWVRRRRWRAKTALIDAALAAGVALVLSYLASEVEGFFGVYRSPLAPAFIVAVAIVVVRHLIPPRTTGAKPPTR